MHEAETALTLTIYDTLVIYVLYVLFIGCTKHYTLLDKYTQFILRNRAARTATLYVPIYAIFLWCVNPLAQRTFQHCTCSLYASVGIHLTRHIMRSDVIPASNLNEHVWSCCHKRPKNSVGNRR